jgi:cytochrome c55X
MRRHYGRGALAVAAALVLGLSATADPVAESGKAGDDRPDAEQVQRGKQLYAAHCSHCHGFNMVNPGTVAYDLRQFPHDQKSRFVSSVTNGKNGRMPQWGDVLSREEIDKLWAYVETGGSQ